MIEKINFLNLTTMIKTLYKLKQNKMKNLLNNTILKDLQAYKITHKNSGRVLYLPSASAKNFIDIQTRKGKIRNYIFASPASRKAQRVSNILDYIVLSSVFTALCLVSYNLIVTQF